jgi:hypothetical protein
MYFLFNRTTLQVFVTYLTGALYLHPLWFYKHQHDNRVRHVSSDGFNGGSDSYLQSRHTHAPCLLKLCIPPSNGIVRWWLFPEFGAELQLDNCTPTIILSNPVCELQTADALMDWLLWTDQFIDKLLMQKLSCYNNERVGKYKHSVTTLARLICHRLTAVREC